MPESSSSTEASPPGHVVVGRVGKPHGLRGDVFVQAETDNPDRFASGSVLFVGGVERTVRASRTQDDRLIVAFDGVDGREVAESLRGCTVTIPESERRELGVDEWWPDDLVGLTVEDHEGVKRGVIVDVLEGVAQHRLVVDTPIGMTEVPFVAALVPVVDLDRRVVRLADVVGLLNPDRG